MAEFSRTGPVLLAKCKVLVTVFKDKQWKSVFGLNSLRLHIARTGDGAFMLLIVDEQKEKIAQKIHLQFNTVFKVINENSFSLLEDGKTLWNFKTLGDDCQKFANVVKNSLASLKAANSKQFEATSQPTVDSKTMLDIKSLNADPKCYLNNICVTLADAINVGNEQFAGVLVKQLVAKKALVSVQLIEKDREMFNDKISVKVQVEDKETISTQFRLDVSPHTTVEQLQQLVEAKYKFPQKKQNWIIGKRLANCTDTLLHCGIKKSDSTLFLYLTSEKKTGEQEQPSLRQSEPVLQDTTEIYDDIYEEPEYAPISVVPGLVNTDKWRCQTCTFLNEPTRPGCEMCATDRPDGYQVPQGYIPNEKERERIEREQSGELLIQQEEERVKQLQLEERDRNLQQLLSIVDQPIITNSEQFECPICFDDVKVGEGIVLRECLHNFCRDCVASHVQNSQEPQVQCPYNDDTFACHDVVTPQEVHQLLSDEDYLKYLQRSLSTAESQAQNSFHCQTPNCKGWCIYDDEVNIFDCPVCEKKNCLTCKAIHHPVNCHQYQNDLKRNAHNDEAARKTQQYLEHMLETNDGMYCPCCGIILVKKDGCDWMKCTMCKTEICWAVRGPRWGPAGPGDTSGGCRCNINNKKCNPNCRNCH